MTDDMGKPNAARHGSSLRELAEWMAILPCKPLPPVNEFSVADHAALTAPSDLAQPTMLALSEIMRHEKRRAAAPGRADLLKERQRSWPFLPTPFPA